MPVERHTRNHYLVDDGVINVATAHSVEEYVNLDPVERILWRVPCHATHIWGVSEPISINQLKHRAR